MAADALMLGIKQVCLYFFLLGRFRETANPSEMTATQQLQQIFVASLSIVRAHTKCTEQRTNICSTLYNDISCLGERIFFCRVEAMKKTVENVDTNSVILFCT